MSGSSPRSAPCCQPRGEGITYLELGPQHTTVGMVGLDTIFQQLWALGRQPEQASDQELVDMARKFNWIPYNSLAEAEYAIALRAAYAGFCAQREGNRGQASR